MRFHSILHENQIEEIICCLFMRHNLNRLRELNKNKQIVISGIWFSRSSHQILELCLSASDNIQYTHTHTSHANRFSHSFPFPRKNDIDRCMYTENRNSSICKPRQFQKKSLHSVRCCNSDAFISVESTLADDQIHECFDAETWLSLHWNGCRQWTHQVSRG